ncbi:MAG: hypothetical protein ABH860_04630 [bacterium]
MLLFGNVMLKRSTRNGIKAPTHPDPLNPNETNESLKPALIRPIKTFHKATEMIKKKRIICT